MDSILSLIVSAENVRMLVMLVFGFSGFVLMNSKMGRLEFSLSKKIDGLDHKIDMVELSLNKRMDSIEASLNKRIDSIEISLNKRIDSVEASLNKRIDSVESSINGRIDDLKNNDFAHLNGTIEALTYALEKNGALQKEDKEYVDSRLAHK